MQSHLQRPSILDTTLREGMQTPNVMFQFEERKDILISLDSANIDYIEIGSPYASKEEQEICNKLAELSTNASKVVHCRALERDIDRAPEDVDWVALYLATSHKHLITKFSKYASPEKFVLKQVPKAIEYAKDMGFKVRYTAEDATSTDLNFLTKVILLAAEAGADSISIPDTRGIADYVQIGELYKMVRRILDDARFRNVMLEAHFHNDLGLALSNTLSAWFSGADILHSSINGLGERAGITDTLQLATALKVKYQTIIYEDVNYDLPSLYELSLRVSRYSGVPISPHWPVSGANVFTHTAGTHQKAASKDPLTYQPFSASLVNRITKFVLGPLCGKEGVRAYLKQMGIDVSKIPEELIITLRDAIKQIYFLHGASAKNLERRVISEVLEEGGFPISWHSQEHFDSIVLVSTLASSSEDSILDDFSTIHKKCNYVKAIYETWGSLYDYVFLIRNVPSIAELNNIIDMIREVEGVTKTETLIIGKEWNQ